jgi:hypothetical protein
MAHLLVVGEPPAKCQTTCKKNSVFSVLTANAAQAFQTHHFLCDLKSGGSWQTGLSSHALSPRICFVLLA